MDAVRDTPVAVAVATATPATAAARHIPVAVGVAVPMEVPQGEAGGSEQQGAGGVERAPASWARVLGRSARHFLLNEPRCGDPRIDAHRRSMHSMRGRWAMEATFGRPPLCPCTPCLLVHRLLLYARQQAMQPRRLPLHQVCFKVGRLNMRKFRSAEPHRFPCFAVETRDNPAGRPFRVIDGKHRIHRLVADHLSQASASATPGGPDGVVWGSFIVFSVAELVASCALVLVPNHLFARQQGDPEHQMDSGSTDCAAWLAANAQALGLTQLRELDAAQAAAAAGGSGEEGGAEEGEEEERHPLLC